MAAPPTSSAAGEGALSEDGKHCLECKVRLRDSILWQLQEAFYEAHGQAAWPSQVPTFISSNAKFAKDYARIIFHFLRDVFSPPAHSAAVPPDGPCLILEIGGGHGRLTHLLLKSLLAFQPYFESLGLPPRPFVYFFTDVAKSNLESQCTHPDLKPYSDAGWLQFAAFDANNPPCLEGLQALARRAGCTMKSGGGVPTVIICNYVLDSLRQEALQFGTSPPVVREGLLSVFSSQEETTLHDLGLTSRLTFSWDWEESEGLTHAAMADSTLDGWDTAELAVVREYLNSSRKMTALLPIAGFRIVQAIRKLAGNQLIMLTGDKGHRDTSEFDGWSIPHLAVHGSFSMMVNFHALQVFFEHSGGWAEHTPYHDVFQVGVYGLGQRSSYPSLLSCLVDCWNDMGPGTMMFWSKHLSALLNEKEDNNKPPLAKLALALLRYGGHDPDVFWQFHPLIYSQSQVTQLNSRGVKDLAFDLGLVYKNRFHMHGADEQDLPLALGECCLRAGRASEAAEFFHRSVEDHGEDADVLVQLSKSLQAADRIPEALVAVRDALRLDPSFGRAQKQLQTLEALNNRLGICFVGGGVANMEMTGPLLAKDVRFHIKAVFAFKEEEAQKLADVLRLVGQDASAQQHGFSHLELGRSLDVLWGSEGLQDILRRSDIEACIVDIHHKLLMALLPKLWAAGKHVMSQSPLAFDLATARNLMQAYQASAPSSIALPAWHALEVSRHEEALDLALNSLGTVGRPLCISLVSTSLLASNGAGTPREAASSLPVEEELALELVHCIAIVLKVTNDRLASISVQIGEASLVQNSGCKGSCGTVGKGQRRAEMALVGHFSVCPASLTSASIGTFLVCRTAAPPGLELRFHCARGALVLARERAAWSYKVTNDHGGGFGQKSLERTVPLQGNKRCHDAFLQQVAKSPVKEADTSVNHALADTAVLESILASIRGGGTSMTFKYAN